MPKQAHLLIAPPNKLYKVERCRYIVSAAV